MNPHHHREPMVFVLVFLLVRRIYVQKKAILAATRRRAKKARLGASATELGCLKHSFEMRGRSRRQPTQVSDRRGSIGYAEVLIFTRRGNALQRSLIRDDGRGCGCLYHRPDICSADCSQTTKKFKAKTKRLVPPSILVGV